MNITRGLRKKKDRITTHTKSVSCDNCNGIGEIRHGQIAVDKKGDYDFFTDCKDCEGTGKTNIKYKKIRRKSRVEII